MTTNINEQGFISNPNMSMSAPAVSVGGGGFLPQASPVGGTVPVVPGVQYGAPQQPIQVDRYQQHALQLAQQEEADRSAGRAQVLQSQANYKAEEAQIAAHNRSFAPASLPPAVQPVQAASQFVPQALPQVPQAPQAPQVPQAPQAPQQVQKAADAQRAVASTQSFSTATEAPAAAPAAKSDDSLLDGSNGVAGKESLLGDGKIVSGAPDAYTDFAFSGTDTINENLLTQFKEVGKNNDFSQQQMQNLISFQERLQVQNKSQLEQERNLMREESQSDPEIAGPGGVSFQANVNLIQSGVRKYFTPGLVDLLKSYGLDNHKEVLKLGLRLGSESVQDVAPINVSPAPVESDELRDFYPTMYADKGRR